MFSFLYSTILCSSLWPTCCCQCSYIVCIFICGGLGSYSCEYHDRWGCCAWDRLMHLHGLWDTETTCVLVWSSCRYWVKPSPAPHSFSCVPVVWDAVPFPWWEDQYWLVQVGWLVFLFLHGELICCLNGSSEQEENLSAMNTDPWYSAYHYSHPPLVERLQALDDVEKKKFQ